jgi:GT2 family glycosyltransferase
VVVNYQHGRDTLRLVRQLRASACLRRGDAEVVVVDNQSPARPLVGRLRRLPGVSLRRWRRNRGFARAVNEGCRLSRGDWVLLLNPDVTLAPDFLDQALARSDRLAAEQPDLGIVGIGLRNPDGSRQPSCGPFPTLAGTLARLLLPRARRKYGAWVRRRAGAADWVSGCGLLVRRHCWEQLGGLDARFFLYYEDVDLCRRAREQGWRVCYDPSLTAIHHHPLHGRPVPPALRLITRHALLTYSRKHWPAWQFQVLTGIVRAEAWLRRLAARRRGDAAGAGVFTDLGRLAADLSQGREREAGRRLLRVVRRQEERHASRPVPRHPQS